MNTQLLSRLFYLACELRPDLPNRSLLGSLGKAWSGIIEAGAVHGLAGSIAALPGTSMDQLSQLYISGAETGATPDAAEFRAGLAAAIYERICGNENLSIIEQIKLSGQLGTWFAGRDSVNGDGEMDWDAEVTTPPFTKTGFWPLDRIAGNHGVPQEVVTLLAQPEAGKTTMALALALMWRRKDIGPVTMIQTEIAPAALRMKIDGMLDPGEKLFRSGVDRLVFGRRAADNALDSLLKNPDPDRLVIFDSIGGYAGQGDGPESRTRFADLFDALMQVKNESRMVVSCGHVKRGLDGMVDIEAAAGSSAVERFSGVLLYLDKDPTARPDGLLQARLQVLKNRYAGHLRPVKFLMDYRTGRAYEDDIDQLEAQVAGEDLV